MALDGTKVAVVGSFKEGSRDDLIAKLKSKGAIVVDDLAPDVEIMFAGEEAGYAPDEAQELGIPVRDEAALKSALEGNTQRKEKPLPPVDDSLPDLPPGHPAATGSPVDDHGSAPAPAPKPTAQQSQPQGPPSGSGDAKEFGKGAKIKIIGGTEGVGKVGHIFWWGDSKFGDGMRAGVKGEDEETYWVDEENLGWPDEEIPEDILELAEQASQFGKGDRVRVTGGKSADAEGVIFWWGESKWGDGMRAGLKTDDDETVWADAENLEKLEGAADAEPETHDDDPIPF